ncbi:MAG: hypothetical protein ABID54_09270, partial [Pseudomonadota bacterium]
MGRFGSERGIALIVALLVITILFVLVIEFNYLTRVDVTIAANIRDENKALYVAKAGVNAAIALLKRDSNNYDAPSEDWGSFASLPHSEYLGEGSVAGSITDESGKININRIVDANSKSLQQLKR